MKQRALQSLGAVLLAACWSPLPLSADVGTGAQEVEFDLIPAEDLPSPVSPVSKGESEEFDLAALQPMAEEELSEQRGGFMFEGMNVNFGAELRTYLGDELVLQTNLTVDDAVNVTQFVSPSLTAVDAANLPGGVLDTGTIRVLANGNDLFLANDGQTIVSHRFDGALQNIFLNTMSGVSGRQEIDANIGLTGNEAFRSSVVTESALSQIQGMLNHALSLGN